MLHMAMQHDPFVSSQDRELVFGKQNSLLLALAKNETLDAGDLRASLHLITEAAAAGLGCARASIWLYAQEQTKIVCLDLYEQRTSTCHSAGAELWAKDFPNYFQALAADRTIAASDAHHHPATREFSAVYLTPLGIGAMLEAPIRQHGRLLGVLCNEHVGPPRTFSQEDQIFAGALADMVSRALHAEKRHQAELALQRANEALEEQVRVRTASLQTVLDSMGDGLLLCELSGALCAECSRAIVTWFGPYEPGLALWEYLAPTDDALRDRLSLGYAQMAADILPFELSVAQMPDRLVLGERTFALSYRPIFAVGFAIGQPGPETLHRLMIIVRDITATLAQERSEQWNRELGAILRMLMQNRDAFLAFIEDAERLLRQLHSKTRSIDEKLRDLHTLKGNAAINGLTTLSMRCHEVEDQALMDPALALTPSTIIELEHHLEETLRPIAVLLRTDEDPMVRLSIAEHRDFMVQLGENQDRQVLLELARSWQRERLATLLQPVRAQAERLARQLGKEVEVLCEDNGLRLPDKTLRPFFATLIHNVRNAIDHGIEVPDCRVAVGKPRRGRLFVGARFDGSTFIVTVSDDGAGVDWEAVRRSALRRGLPATTPQDLEQALFRDGFSTRDAVTALSGRGVGLSASHQLCTTLGGQVSLQSTPGHGTRIEYRFPKMERRRPTMPMLPSVQ